MTPEELITKLRKANYGLMSSAKTRNKRMGELILELKAVHKAHAETKKQTKIFSDLLDMAKDAMEMYKKEVLHLEALVEDRDRTIEEMEDRAYHAGIEADLE
jgi:hypothetical protein